MLVWVRETQDVHVFMTDVQSPFEDDGTLSGTYQEKHLFEFTSV